MAESRPLAYTTIMTVLDRLVRKGMLPPQSGPSFQYAPTESRDTRGARPFASFWRATSTGPKRSFWFT